MRDLLNWLNENFLPIWNPLSIALTGAFGILGLLTEFKDKRKPHKIKPWGWVALLGIVLSTLGGVVAQTKEYREEKLKAAAAQRQEERVLAPLGDPIVGIEFSVACSSDVSFKKLCRPPSTDPSHYGQIQPPLIFGPLEASLEFVMDPQKGQLCLATAACGRDLYLQVKGTATALLYEGGELRVRADNMTVSLRRMPVNGLYSALDIPGTTVMVHVTHSGNQFGPLAMRELTLKLTNGNMFFVYSPFDIAGPKYSVSYGGTFAK